LIPRWILAA